MAFTDIEYDITQEDWAWSHPYAFIDQEPTVMELHHAVVPTDRYDSENHALNIQRIHLGKGWNGAFYNVGVHSITGEIVELRGVGNRSTILAPDALTVVLFGDHHIYDGHRTADIISDKALESLTYIANLAPDPDGLRGHFERPYATACPGVHAMNKFVYPYRAGEFTTSPPSPPVTPQKVTPMPYAMARHNDGQTMYALFKHGVVRAIGPAEKAYLDTKRVPVIRTDSDVEEKHWKAAAEAARS